MDVAAGQARDTLQVEIGRRTEGEQVRGLPGNGARRGIGQEMIECDAVEVDPGVEQLGAELREQAHAWQRGGRDRL